jgi:hypothetical protein
MVIKGGALDILVYDQPYHTVLADIDLILSIKPSDIPAEIFRDYMVFFHKSGIEYDFYQHHDMSMNGALPIDFDTIWNDAFKIRYQEFDIFVMSPEDMLIAVCINSCRKRFFRLKSLCDIAEIINKYTDLNWEMLTQKAKIYHCQNIVYTALLATKMTVGCHLPEGLFDALGVNPIRSKIIRSLSRRMSLSAFSSLSSGRPVLKRRIDWPLILPYATFYGYQMWRRMKFVLSSRN